MKVQAKALAFYEQQKKSSQKPGIELSVSADPV
jgi:hypothetical protein